MMLLAALLMAVPQRDLELDREPTAGIVGAWICGVTPYRISQRGEDVWIDGKNYRAVGHYRHGILIVFWQPVGESKAVYPGVYVLHKGQIAGYWWNNMQAAADGRTGNHHTMRRANAK